MAFLRKGDFRTRLATEFEGEKARSILQLSLGIIAGADRMIGAVRAAGDPLIQKYLVNPVEETQLARDFNTFTKPELERFQEWVSSIAILDLVRDIPQSESIISP